MLDFDRKTTLKKVFRIIVQILFLIGSTMILTLVIMKLALAVQMGGPGSFNMNIFADDINGASRSVVKNFNNGNSASAQLNLENDIGRRISLGIGSSALNLTGTEGPNSAALLLESQANLLIGILYDDMIKWAINSSDDGTLANLVTVMDLDSDGLRVFQDMQADDYFSGDGSQGIDKVFEITEVGTGICTFTVKDGLITSTTC